MVLPILDTTQILFRFRLPYTMAAITESFRMNPIAPLSVMHINPHDVKLRGYDIPKVSYKLIKVFHDIVSCGLDILTVSQCVK